MYSADQPGTLTPPPCYPPNSQLEKVGKKLGPSKK